MDKKTLSGLSISDFQKKVDGIETKLYVLTNKAGAEVTVLNYGARIVSLMVPDKNGTFIDVVTGYQTIDDYLTTTEKYFGAVCGRYANRIAGGKFTIDGVVYDRLALNNGPNNLHGGIKGFNSVMWGLALKEEQTIVLEYASDDGDEGFPGNIVTTVMYHLSDDNALYILYTAMTDRPTVLNMTNHSFFNLSGAGNPSINDHVLIIDADHYLPTDATAIPYGPQEKVEGTPFDFREPRYIGERIDDDFEQLVFGKGYDHNFVLNKPQGQLSICARSFSPQTGILMDVATTEPGIQLYTGNWMTGKLAGKHGQLYPMRSAFCLETQHFPDSPNKPEYPSTIIRPEQRYSSSTVYKFSITNYKLNDYGN